MRRLNAQPVFKTTKPGLARPNQAYTIRQINERFVQGKSIPSSKQAIKEPKLESGINPMRRPYCDYIDVFQYNQDLTDRLNKSEALLTEKRAQLNAAISEADAQHRESIIEEAKKRLRAEQP